MYDFTVIIVVIHSTAANDSLPHHCPQQVKLVIFLKATCQSLYWWAGPATSYIVLCQVLGPRPEWVESPVMIDSLLM